MSGNPFGVMIETSFKESEALQKITEAMKEIQNLEALIGIPQEANVAHKDESGADSPITLAELLYIHTHGSPVNKIPARDVLDSAMKHNREDISMLLEKVLERASNGDLEGAKAALDKTGIQGASMAQKWFTDPANGWAKNADITVDGGWMKNKVSGKTFYVKGKGSNRPLVDTGELRKSITSVVRRKGKTKR